MPQEGLTQIGVEQEGPESKGVVPCRATPHEKNRRFRRAVWGARREATPASSTPPAATQTAPRDGKRREMPFVFAAFFVQTEPAAFALLIVILDVHS
jgi:hypothetical protein